MSKLSKGNDFIVRIYDGREQFELWVEEMQLYFMASNLWTIVTGDENCRERKEWDKEHRSEQLRCVHGGKVPRRWPHVPS